MCTNNNVILIKYIKSSPSKCIHNSYEQLFAKRMYESLTTYYSDVELNHVWYWFINKQVDIFYYLKIDSILIYKYKPVLVGEYSIVWQHFSNI